MKQWSILMMAEIPDEVDAEHVRSGTAEAMGELDFWRVRVLSVVEIQPPAESQGGAAEGGVS